MTNLPDLTLDTLIASVRYGPEADSRAAEAELRRLAAPPPAGVLHPLLQDVLNAADMMASAAPFVPANGPLDIAWGRYRLACRLWREAESKPDTAAPPTLSPSQPSAGLAGLTTPMTLPQRLRHWMEHGSLEHPDFVRLVKMAADELEDAPPTLSAEVDRDGERRGLLKAYEECAALCQGLAQDYADVKNDEAMLAAEWCAAGLRKLAEETRARAPVTPTPEPTIGIDLGAGESWSATAVIQAPEPLAGFHAPTERWSEQDQAFRTPEPATVEPVCAGPFVDARHCPVHAKDLRAPEPATVGHPFQPYRSSDPDMDGCCSMCGLHKDRHAAPEPARPPAVTPPDPPDGPWVLGQSEQYGGLPPDARPSAVTRTIRERVEEAYRATPGDYGRMAWSALWALIDVLDEDEARRDADRQAGGGGST